MLNWDSFETYSVQLKVSQSQLINGMVVYRHFKVGYMSHSVVISFLCISDKLCTKICVIKLLLNIVRPAFSQ